jgi:predicted cobalt transporter CbtA
VNNSANDIVCREKRLLVLCARTRATLEISEEIHRLTEGPLDWDCLLSEAFENSITPLLDAQLRAAAPDRIPLGQRERLTTACRANAVRSLFLTAELTKILEAFRSQGIQATPYKGPVLAAQAYGDVTRREFEDLDIVLLQRDMPKAHKVMLALAYRPKFDWILSAGAAASLVPGEYNYRDEPRRVMVELHTEITLRHFPIVPDLQELARNRVPVLLSGYEVLTFSPEDGLPILCIHGSKDFWERLSWIADISELIQAYPGLDWDVVRRHAESLNAERMLHLGLALANRLLGAPLPKEIAKRVEADHVAMTVASEVSTRLLSRDLPVLDAAGRFQFRRRMLTKAFAGWRYATRLAVVPAEEDWLMMRLPPALAPLYLVLRPFRLLRKYGWPSRKT